MKYSHNVHILISSRGSFKKHLSILLFILGFLFNLFSHSLLAQTQKTDSLLQLISSIENSQYDLIIKNAEKGTQLAIENKDTVALVRFLVIQSNSLKVYGDMNKALSKAEQALTLAVSADLPLYLGETHALVGSIHQSMGSFQQARTFYDEAISYAKKVDDLNTVWFAQNNIATSFQRQGNYEASLPILNRLSSDTSISKSQRMKSMANRAIAFRNLGKPVEALKSFLTVKEYALEEQDKRLEAKLNHHIGYLLENINMYKNAIDYYQRASNYFEKLQQDEQKAYLDLNIANIHVEIQDFETAEKHYQSASSLFSKSGVSKEGAIALGLGKIAFHRGQYTRAETHYEKAFLAFERQKRFQGMGTVILQQGELAFVQKSIHSADTLAKKALDIFLDLSLQDPLIDVYTLLHSIELKKGVDIKTSSYKKALDSLLIKTEGPEVIASASKILIQDMLSTQNQAPQQELTKTPSWIIVLGVLLVLGLGLFFGTRWRNQQKPSAQQESKERLISLKETEAQMLSKKLKDAIADNVYTNPELTLSDLAEQLETTDKKLSELLNHYSNTTFYAYMNQYRIQLFIQKVTSGKLENYTVLGLAEQCGFKSKSSFYRNFKKLKGISPKEFVDSLS